MPYEEMKRSGHLAPNGGFAMAAGHDLRSGIAIDAVSTPNVLSQLHELREYVQHIHERVIDLGNRLDPILRPEILHVMAPNPEMDKVEHVRRQERSQASIEIMTIEDVLHIIEHRINDLRNRADL